MRKVLVTGDRDWTNRRIVKKELSQFEASKTVIVHGAARGLDTIADQIAKELGMLTEPWPAEWTRYGKSAGPIRNRVMYQRTKPNVVLAFHDDILFRSRGTKHMVFEIALPDGCPVKLITTTCGSKWLNVKRKK